jgi:hypothetical protein
MFVAALCLLNSTPAFSADNESWNHYENDFFVAYSNADEESVTNILESLEQFRAAAFQIPSFVIPEGRPKTLVILPATHEEFLTFAYYETMAGFAAVLAGRPTIVLPASDPDLDLRIIVGHEFAHTLLFNDYFNYPSWYAEGFAEIASSIVIDPADNTFSVGARDDHRKKAAKPAIDWNDLIHGAFDAHALGDLNRTASAYAQNWLLVHYLTLNESADYASELNGYFANIINGMPSHAAFPEAFGKTAAEFWQNDLQTYLDQIENRVFSFNPSLLDLDFQTSPAVDYELHPILKFLKDYADVRHGRNAPTDAVPHLPGRWDWFKLESQCSEPMTFRLREDTRILVLESFYSDDLTDPVPALFDITSDDDGALMLANITSDEYPQVKVTSDYKAVMRSKDVMCFDAQPAARDCLRILHRCDN